jgi:hypothetical protein
MFDLPMGNAAMGIPLGKTATENKKKKPIWKSAKAQWATPH